MKLSVRESTLKLNKEKEDIKKQTRSLIYAYRKTVKGKWKLLQFQDNRVSKERRTKDYSQMVKLRRAQGECLGTESRRRTRLTAISHGEP